MKEIPVYLEGKFIEMTPETPYIVERIYHKFKRIFGVKKVYHDRGKRVNMETKYRPPYQVISK